MTTGCALPVFSTYHSTSMADDLQDVIRAARKEVSVCENDGNSSFSMPDSGHSPFDSSLSNEGRRRTGSKDRSGVTASATRASSKPVAVYQWSEGLLRIHGSNRDRALMAVRDAARIVAGKGKDPFVTPFYVAETIARGWDLDVSQLSKSLKDLAKKGCIAITESQKGKHVRMTLIRTAPS